MRSESSRINRSCGGSSCRRPAAQDFAVRLVVFTHPRGPFATPMVTRFLRFGASPRPVQTIALAPKVRALLEGRSQASFDDVKRCILPAMQHRCLLNFEAEAEGIGTDEVVWNIGEATPTANR